VKPFFVIVGSRDAEGATLSVAPNAYNVEIENRQDLGGYDFGRSPYQYQLNGSLLTIKAESRASRFYHVQARCYAEAWERLLDLWVPPDCTKQTHSQILTHFTLNPDRV
jgi:hypothetical protein